MCTLARAGTSGVELLTNCMNNYFTRVMNMILAFDGDVVKFAGDSMIVTFAPSEQEVRFSEVCVCV
jgi:class 3 adenylate cyclase